MSVAKQAEKIVFDYFNSCGKDTMITRLIDSADINRQGYKKGVKFTVVSFTQPSDMILTRRGKTSYLEIKTTEDVKGIKKSLFLRQNGSKRRVLAAGGLYEYFIYSVANNQWFNMSAEELDEVGENARWEQLEAFKIDYLRKV